MANRQKKKPGSERDLRSVTEPSPVSTPMPSRSRVLDEDIPHFGNNGYRVPVGSSDDLRRMQLARYPQDPPEYDGRYFIPNPSSSSSYTSTPTPESLGGFMYRRVTAQGQGYLSTGNAGAGDFHRPFLAHVHNFTEIVVKDDAHAHHGNIAQDDFGKFHYRIFSHTETTFSQGCETPTPTPTPTSTPTSSTSTTSTPTSTPATTPDEV